MKRIAWSYLLGTLLLCGCNQSAPTTGDMNADFDHNHRHQHGTGHDHEHDHDDGFAGGHSHEHGHGHRHGKPLHGGRLVSIGHSHHAEGATHYHAEIMPLVDGRVTIHLLTENDAGESVAFPIEVAEITAYVDRLDREDSLATEIVFTAEGDGPASEFVTTVPETHRDSAELSIVVPKVKLGGERQNFSFTVSTGEQASNAGSEATPPASSDPDATQEGAAEEGPAADEPTSNDEPTSEPADGTEVGSAAAAPTGAK
ncbi:MAG: hypothetical protein CL681_26525 [Blastopirellula sp.]|nr:hypothetical protein [Blastopirellula sp.]